jgi:hypothetical protein
MSQTSSLSATEMQQAAAEDAGFIADWRKQGSLCNVQFFPFFAFF